MMKKVLIGLGIIAGLLIVAAAIGVYHFLPSEKKMVDFIKDNPERSSILFLRNDTVLANRNMDKVMPLASTVKIILAIEYAEQCANGQINPEEFIPLDDLNKFYVPNTDGGAHKNWLIAIEDKIADDQITIREISKGMIKFSSNANTEWLLNKLGAKQVNNRLDSLGLKNHTEIYDIVSALFVGKELFPDLKGKNLEKKLKELEQSEYIAATKTIHQKLLLDTLYKKEVGELGMEIQKIWSDRLPSSTVGEYVEVMKKVNRRDYFSPDTQMYLDELMEYMLENPANKEWLVHAGMGGVNCFCSDQSIIRDRQTR